MFLRLILILLGPLYNIPRTGVRVSHLLSGSVDHSNRSSFSSSSSSTHQEKKMKLIIHFKKKKKRIWVVLPIKYCELRDMMFDTFTFLPSTKLVIKYRYFEDFVTIQVNFIVCF